MNSKCVDFLTAVAIIAFYECIGYLLKIDVLKIFTFSGLKLCISIVGVLICIFTAAAIRFLAIRRQHRL